MSFQIGIAQWVVILLALAVVLAAAIRRTVGSTADLVFWLSVVTLAMILMTPASAPVWELIAPLRFVQFPWRFLMLVAVAGGALAAALLSTVRNTTTRGIIVVAAAALQVWLAADQVGHPRRIATGRMTIDYPAWAQTPQAQAMGFAEAGYYPAGVSPDEDLRPPGRWSVTDGEAAVEEVVVKDHRVTLDVRTGQGAGVAIHSPYFPGWTLRRDGREVELARLPGSGYLLVDVPPGAHRIEAVFTETPLRRCADLISLGGFCALLALVVASIRSRRARLP